MSKDIKEYVEQIAVKTGRSTEEIEKLIIQKQEDNPTYAKYDSAIVKMVCDDLVIDLNGNNKTEKFDLTIKKAPESLAMVEVSSYPTEAEILFLVKRRKFVKETIIDKKEDIVDISGTPFLKKTGTQKYINAFGISIEIISSNVYYKDEDVIAEYRVKAIAPNGQFVVGDGTKSKSEYWSDKYQSFGSYSLHNLKATARTKAIHVVVSDIVGYGELSLANVPENAKQKFNF